MVLNRADKRAASTGNKKAKTAPAKKLPKERKRSKLAVPRWCIPQEQLERLEEMFEQERSPSFAVREELAEEFGATTRQVRPRPRPRGQKPHLAPLASALFFFSPRSII